MSSSNNAPTQPPTGNPAQAGVQGSHGGVVDAYVPDLTKYEFDPAVLLALAPRNPVTEFVSRSDVTQVRYELVKKGQHAGRKAFFVVLEVSVPSTHVDVLLLDVFFTTPEGQTPVANSHGATTTPAPGNKSHSSGFHEAMTRVKSGFKSVRSGVSSLCKSATCQSALPPPVLPRICVAGPRSVYGPAIRVNNKDANGWKMDPNFQGAGFGGGGISVDWSREQRYQIEQAPWIRVDAEGNHAVIRAEKAAVGAARLPPLFHVGFVVRSDSDIKIAVTRSGNESVAAHLHVQNSRPMVLKDRTGHGTHPSTFTCTATDRCPNGGGRACKEFYPTHMTEASWKEKLTPTLRSWDYRQNDGCWYYATEV